MNGKHENTSQIVSVVSIISLLLIYMFFHTLDIVPGKMNYALRVLFSSMFMLGIIVAACPRKAIAVWQRCFIEREVSIKRLLVITAMFFTILVQYGHFFGWYIKTPEIPLNKVNLLSSLLILSGYVFLLRRKTTYISIFLYVLAVGTVLRILAITYIPLMPGPDMLPMDLNACKNFLSGVFPYKYYSFPYAEYGFTSGYDYKCPCPHLPLTWLAYFPFYVLRLDIRWFNVLANLGLILFLFFSATEKEGCSRTFKSPYFCILLCVLYLFPGMIYSNVFNQIVGYWFFLAGFGYFLLKKRLLLSAVFYGLALSTRQFAVLLVPFIFFYLLKAHDLKTCIKYFAICLGLFLATVLPFYLWSREEFVYSIIGHFISDKTFHGTVTVKLEELGFSWMVLVFGKYGKVITVSAYAAILVRYALLREESLKLLFVYSAFAYFAFLFFPPTSFVYPYYYSAPLIILIMGTFVGTDREQEAVSGHCRVQGANESKSTDMT